MPRDTLGGNSDEFSSLDPLTVAGKEIGGVEVATGFNASGIVVTPTVLSQFNCSANVGSRPLTLTLSLLAQFTGQSATPTRLVLQIIDTTSGTTIVDTLQFALPGANANLPPQTKTKVARWAPAPGARTFGVQASVGGGTSGQQGTLGVFARDTNNSSFLNIVER